MTKASDKQVGGSHYATMPIQPSEFIYVNGLNWLQGNAIKYVCRHARKGGAEDLEKAKHYIDLLMEWEYNTDAKLEKPGCKGCGQAVRPPKQMCMKCEEAYIKGLNK